VKFDERYSGMGNRWKLCSANVTVRKESEHIQGNSLSKPAVALLKQK
jgi:hypothetical protein